MKLANLAPKINKVLAVAVPGLTSISAAASAAGLVATDHHHSSWMAAVTVAAGTMAAAVLEHEGQIGMVVEMYMSCAGFFYHLRLMKKRLGRRNLMMR
ncbi:Probable F-box protein At4g22030 [Linum perenne]